MATRVKINDLVASTSRYTKRAAARADKNKSKRLTRAEAKTLPKDLRDDFNRQLGKKTSISTEKFAADQVAYTAAAARRADQNHDGVLSATEQRSLPATLKDNVASYAAGAAASPAKPGVTATSAPAALRAPMQQLTTSSGGVLSNAAAFKGDVAKLLADPQANKTQLNRMLFDATNPVYLNDYPDYYGPDRLEVAATTAAQARKELAVAFSVDLTPQDVARRTAIERDARKVVDALAEPGVKLLKLLWTNQDDASFEAVFAINAKTGTLRSAGWWNEP